MTEDSWWKNKVIYEIYPKSFCDSNGDGIGDLPGIVSKLDYLKDLGIAALWICPIYPSGGYDNGYDITDYEAVDPCYGTREDLGKLIEQAHGRGMKVILDLVVNHTSDLHPWFQRALADETAPERDYYIWRDPGADGRAPNNWGALFGGSAWTYDEGSGQYYLGLFSARQPDLNWKNPALRQKIYDMVRRWLDFGVDGFRMDVISLIAKPEDFSDGPTGESGYCDPRARIAANPKVHEYLKEMRKEAFAGKEAVTVGEAAFTTLKAAKQFSNQDGSELDMVFWFEHMDLDGGETFKWNDKKIPLPELKRVMEKWQRGLAGYGWSALFWNNHDQPRMLSRLGDEKRLREKSAKMLAMCLYLMQGTVFCYQGEELGMTNMRFLNCSQLKDSESINAYHRYVGEGRITEENMLSYISQKSRDTARTPMQWNDQPQAGFTTGIPWMEVNSNYKEINAREQRMRKDSVYSFYRELIDMRKRCRIVAEGDFSLYKEENARVFAYTRTWGREQLFVCCSFSSRQESFPMPEGFCGKGAEGGGKKRVGAVRMMLGNDENSVYLEKEILSPFEAIALYREEE